MNTDVAPLLRDMDFPILVVLGANDPKIPASLVKMRVESIFEPENRWDSTVWVFPDATHNIVSSPSNCGILCPPNVTGTGPVFPWFAAGYLEAVSDWVIRQVGT